MLVIREIIKEENMDLTDFASRFRNLRKMRKNNENHNTDFRFRFTAYIRRNLPNPSPLTLRGVKWEKGNIPFLCRTHFIVYGISAPVGAG